MKIKKIIDTVPNFGDAERYITFKAPFEKFLKRKFFGKIDLSISAEKLEKKYNLKGFVFGNYVTQEERFYFLLMIEKQLKLLADIRGNNDLGKGKLIIAFGAEGVNRANAHYNPDKQLINLNRGRKGNYEEIFKGEDSFIHEYGHFLDFLQGRKEKHNFNFSSESGKGIFFELIKEAKADDEFDNELRMYSSYKYLSSNIEIFARSFEMAVTYYAKKNKHYSQNFIRSYRHYEYGNIYYNNFDMDKQVQIVKKIIKK